MAGRGLRGHWRRSEEVIEEELDERTEAAAAQVLGRVAGVTVPFAVLAAGALVVAPLSAQQREVGLSLLPFAVLAVASATLAVASRRRRAFSPRLLRATLARSLWAWPVAAAVAGLVELVWHGDPGRAGSIGAAILVGGLVGAALHYRRLAHAD